MYRYDPENEQEVVEINSEQDLIDFINSSSSVAELEVLKYDLTHYDD